MKSFADDPSFAAAEQSAEDARDTTTVRPAEPEPEHVLT
jgi:hypothetical protein